MFRRAGPRDPNSASGRSRGARKMALNSAGWRMDGLCPPFYSPAPQHTRGASSVMKIVGFETSEGLRLGVVDGDSVVDLQAVDSKVPSNLADVLAQYNGDLKPLGDLAKKAPASAHKPL